MRTIFFVLCFLLPLPTLGNEINAGFVDGLWYASAKPFADVPTRMYVAVRNNTDSDLTGTVEFFVDGDRIGRDSVQVIAGRIIEAWADWTPNYGEHTVSARLSRVVVNAVGSNAEEAIAETVLAEDTIMIDYDTDEDGVGNENDSDDDNDGVSDEAERARGSNPLLSEPKPTTDTENNVDEDIKTEATERKTNTATSNSNEPAGLEQYLTDSRAKSTLGSVTNFINTTKTRVDEYRETRATTRTDNTEEPNAGTEETFPEVNEVPTLTASESGTTTSVGDITRSKAGSSWYSTFGHTIVRVVRTILETGFTVILAGLSFTLGHPILLQIALLILILFIFLKLARRVSRRPG